MRERDRFPPLAGGCGSGWGLAIVGLGYTIEVQGLRKSYGSLPGWLQTIAQYSPLSYVSNGLRNISVDGASLWAVRRDLVGIGVWLAISAAIAARLFRWEVTWCRCR